MTDHNGIATHATHSTTHLKKVRFLLAMAMFLLLLLMLLVGWVAADPPVGTTARGAW